MSRISSGDTRRAQQWENGRHERVREEIEFEKRMDYLQDGEADIAQEAAEREAEGMAPEAVEMRREIDEHFDRALGEIRR